MSRKKYSPFEHTADLGLYIYGRDLPELFAAAAAALTAQLTDRRRVRPSEERRIELSADSPEALLRSWLAELLYLYHSEGWLTARVGLESVEERTLSAAVRGEHFEEGRHGTGAEIKAVTWHRLKIEKLEAKGVWRATVVLDV